MYTQLYNYLYLYSVNARKLKPSPYRYIPVLLTHRHKASGRTSSTLESYCNTRKGDTCQMSDSCALYVININTRDATT